MYESVVQASSFAIPKYDNLELHLYSISDINGDFYLLCDKVQDPGNLGTIIRTAHAAGVNAIILTKEDEKEDYYYNNDDYVVIGDSIISFLNQFLK